MGTVRAMAIAPLLTTTQPPHRPWRCPRMANPRRQRPPLHAPACFLPQYTILTSSSPLLRYHPSWEAWRISGAPGGAVETWEQGRFLKNTEAMRAWRG